MADIIQQRRDTAARWAQYNPILLEGEVGYVTDNPNQYKIGNGRDKWNDLPLRGYTGTITQDTGDDENAVMSQKAVSAKLSELGSILGIEQLNIDYINDVLGIEEKQKFSGNTSERQVEFSVKKGDIISVLYTGAIIGEQLAIGIGSASEVKQYIIPGNGYALYENYVQLLIVEQDAEYLRMLGNDVKVMVVAFSQSSVVNDLLNQTASFEQLIKEDITEGWAMQQDGSIANYLSEAWGVTNLIEVKAGEVFIVFAEQYPQAPYVGIQVLNRSVQVQQNYMLGTNLTNNKEIVINIENDGYIRVGARISEGYEHYIKKVTPFRDAIVNLQAIGGGKGSIKKNINFVGMSIWWYDGKQFASGHGGGVIAKGYQTLLREQFDFLSDTGTEYCYSGNSLGAKSEDDVYCIMNHSGEWSTSDNAIWTLDTITNDFKRNIPIGTYSDYSNKTGLLTYYGALREFKDKVELLSGTNAIVVCSNSLRRNNADYTSISQNSNGDKLVDFEYALIDVASRENWYFIDQYRLSGITDESIDLTTLDGLHLNNFGYSLAVKPWIEQFEIIRRMLN